MHGVSLEMWSVGTFRIFKFIEVDCNGEIITLTQKDFGKPVSVNIGGRWFGIANSPPSSRRSVLGSRRRRAMAFSELVSRSFCFTAPHAGAIPKEFSDENCKVFLA